jgi:hypothetical protein
MISGSSRTVLVAGAWVILFCLAVPRPARATVTPVDLAPHLHLLSDKLHLDQQVRSSGSGGDVDSGPTMNAILAESLAGFGAALVSVPVTEALGFALRNISPNIYVALIPVAVLLLAVPSISVTFAEWGVGRALGAEVRLQPAIYVAVAVQFAFLVAGVLAVAWVGDVTQAALFSLAEVLLLPGTVTAVMNIQLGLRPHRPVADLVTPATSPATDRPPERLANALSLYKAAF